MKRVLISGISGFLGARLAQRLQGKVELSGIVNREESDAECETLTLDLADTHLITDRLNALNPDIVMHTAAVSRPLAFAEDPRTCWQVNVVATREMAGWCRRRDRRLLFCSSDTVYADAASGGKPWCETDPLAPVHDYGRSKMEAEAAIAELCPEALVMRLSLLFGTSRPGRNSFSEWLLARYHEGRVPVFNDNRRHTIAVGEVCRVIQRLLENETLSGVLNVGSCDYLSREEFARLLFAHLGLDAACLAPSTTAAAQLPVPLPLELPLNLDRLRNVLGELPRITEQLAAEYPHQHR